MDYSCPILPCVQQYRKQQYEKLMGLLQQHVDCPVNLKKLIQHVPLYDQRIMLGSILLYLLQTRRNPHDDQRILGILEVCPQAATFRDNELMNPMHYLCMRQFGTADDLSILFVLLEAFPNLSRLQNKFGESPLHQLLGQNRPDPRVLRAFVKMCPEAFRDTISYKEGGRLPVHIIMLNSRLDQDPAIIECTRLCIEAFHLGMFVPLHEDRLVLRVNGPAGGVRTTHSWTPYEKAKLEFPKVFDCLERKMEDIALQRVIPQRRRLGYVR